MKKTAQNDITGAWLVSKPNNEMFEKNWDLIFGKKKALEKRLFGKTSDKKPTFNLSNVEKKSFRDRKSFADKKSFSDKKTSERKTSNQKPASKRESNPKTFTKKPSTIRTFRASDSKPASAKRKTRA